jgi:hypothetical protein
MSNAVVMRPTQWANLPDIADVPRIGPEDIRVLSDLRDVLQRNNAVGRFGINLLHRHFDIGDDEILVEYTDEEARVQKIQVEKLSCVQQSEGLIETNWTFDRDTASLVCRGVCVYDRGHRRQHG